MPENLQITEFIERLGKIKSLLGIIMKNDHNGGRTEIINNQKDIALHIGHYIVVNHKVDQFKRYPVISIYGLGSCIALILIDRKNRVGGMSHILLPHSRKTQFLTYPHKYADLSVPYLIKEMENLGADKKSIEAIIVGGSKIFNLDENIIGDENAKIVKEMLNQFEIKISKEEVGGSRGRGVIFDTNNFTVSIKESGENEYRKL